ncbi:MAG TPA: hypothetical protein VMG41_17520 [Gemmatimonadales bacterium]|nr:hypothetical protein [Gemmatimonadales bacterium]
MHSPFETRPPEPRFPERLRFTEFELDRLATGRCRARVVLTWQDSNAYEGESEGLTSQAGELRCAAEACVIALGKAVHGALKFELLGVKAVRAFDASVVIVSLAIPDQNQTHRVVGCFLTEDADPTKGAALAVLNATNRILGNRFFMR